MRIKRQGPPNWSTVAFFILMLLLLNIAGCAGCDSPAPPGVSGNNDGSDAGDDADEPDADEPDADEPDAEPDADEPDADEPLVDEPGIQEELGDVPVDGEFQAGASTGDQVHLAMGEEGCAILDTSDPTRIVTLGTFDTPGSAQDIAADGDSATDYVADGDQGVAIVALDDPTAPEVVGTLDDLEAPATAVSLDAPSNRLACGGGGEVVLYDVTRRREPSQLVSVRLSEGEVGCLGIETHRGIFYVLLDDGSIHGIDGASGEVVWTDGVEGAVDIAVGGGHLAVTLGGGGLVLFALEDGADPTRAEVTFEQAPEAPVTVDGRDELLALAGPEQGVWCVGVGADRAPRLVAVPAEDAAAPEGVVVVEGGVVAVYEDRAAYINTPPFVVATDPADDATDVSPNVRPLITFNEPIDPESIQDTAALLVPDGNFVPVPARVTPAGAEMIEVAPVDDLAVNQEFEMTVQAEVTDRFGATLTPLNGHRTRFTTGDQTDDEALPEVGAAEFEGLPEDAVVVDEYGYFCMDDGDLQVVDLTRPTEPQAISPRVALPGRCRQIAADEDRGHLYIAADDAGLVVVNIEEPTAPVVVVTLAIDDIDGPATACTYDPAPNHVYLGVGGGVVIIDVFDIANPRVVRVGTDIEPQEVISIRLHRGFVYVLYADGLLCGFDRVTLALIEGAVYRGPANPRGFIILGDFAHIACQGTGVVVVELLIDGGLRFVEVTAGVRVDIVALVRRGDTVACVYSDGFVEIYGWIERARGQRVLVLITSSPTRLVLRLAVVLRIGLVLVAYEGGCRLLDIPPFVVGTDPHDGDTGVRVDQSINVYFSEPVAIQPETLINLNAGGSAVASGLELDGPVATLTPSADMAADTDHLLKISRDIKDLGGLSLQPAQDLEVAFTTGDEVGGVDETGANDDLDPGTRALVIIDDTGYACGGQGELQVLDLSDPTAPSVVATLDLPGVCEDILGDEARGVLYIALGQGGMIIISIQDLRAPVIITRHVFDQPGPCTALTRDPEGDGRVIYVSVGLTLVVLDVTDFNNIVVVREGGPATELTVRLTYGGGYVICLLADGTLVTVDPETLEVVDSRDLGDDPVALRFFEGRIYVGYRGSAIVVITLIDGRFDGEPDLLDGGRTDLVSFEVRGGLLICVYGDGSVELYGFVVRGGVRVLVPIGARTGYPGVRIVVVYRGTQVLVIYDGGYAVLDTPPFIVDTLPREGDRNVPTSVRPQVIFSEPVNVPEGAIHLREEGERDVEGETILVAGNVATLDHAAPLAAETSHDLIISAGITDGSGLALVDPDPTVVTFTTGLAGPPSAPTVGGFDAPEESNDLVVVGNYGYLAAGDGGVIVYDLTDPPVPVQVHVIATPGPAWQIVADEVRNVIYVACGGAGVVVIDISDPLTAVIIGDLTLPNGEDCRFIDFFGDTIYCGAGDRIFVISIGVRFVLRVITIQTFEANVVQIRVRGGQLVCAYGNGRIEIFDLRGDPRNPVQVAFWTVELGPGESVLGCDVEDGYVYVIVRGRGIVIYDVRDPGNVVEVTVLPGDVIGVRVRRGVLVCVVAGGEITVFSVGDPRNPVLITVNPFGGTLRVVVAFVDGYLVCIDGRNGHILNLPPFLVFTQPRPGATNVSPRTQVQMIFSEPVEVPEGAIALLNDGETPVDVGLTATDRGQVQIVSPNANLASNTRFVVQATGRITDSTGLAMGQDFATEFTTGQDPNGPSITNVDPTDCHAGRIVTVAGEGFGVDPTPVQVTVAGAPAEVVERDDTELRVVVPGAAAGRSGPLSVITPLGTAISPQSLTVAPAPSISALSPDNGLGGTVVTIEGANFDVEEPENNRVFLGGVRASVVGVEANAITFVVPLDAFTSNVVVTVGGTPSNGLTFTVNIPEGPDAWYRANASEEASRRAAHTSVLRTRTNELIIFGGAAGNPQAPTTIGDLYAINLGTLQWEDIVDPQVQPPSRTLHHAIYDELEDRMVIFGGNNADFQIPVIYDDIWSYDFATGIWTPEGSAIPGLSFRQAGSWTLDPSTRRAIFFGGFDRFGQPLNDTWAYDLDTRSWEPLQTAGAPPRARGGHLAQLAGRELLVFGGQFAPTPNQDVVLNDVHALNLDTLQWRRIADGGERPSPRSGAAGIFDPINDRLIVYGGTTGGTPFRDVRALDLQSGQWTDISPLQGQLPPIRAFHTAHFVAGPDVLVIYGGLIDLANLFNPQFYSDVWVGILQ